MIKIEAYHPSINNECHLTFYSLEAAEKFYKNNISDRIKTVYDVIRDYMTGFILAQWDGYELRRI